MLFCDSLIISTPGKSRETFLECHLCSVFTMSVMHVSTYHFSEISQLRCDACRAGRRPCHGTQTHCMLSCMNLSTAMAPRRAGLHTQSARCAVNFAEIHQPAQIALFVSDAPSCDKDGLSGCIVHASQGSMTDDSHS